MAQDGTVGVLWKPGSTAVRKKRRRFPVLSSVGVPSVGEGKVVMVITRVIGGLGNQMFQYAFGRRTASYHHVPLKLDLSKYRTYQRNHYGLNRFNIDAEIASQEEIERIRGRGARGSILRLRGLLQRLRPYSRRSYVVESSHRFDPKAMFLSGDVYFEGYWQSEKYFKEIEIPLRDELTVRSEPDDANADLLERIEATHAVSLHVRRGDYVSNAKTQRIHGTLKVDYYRNAMRLIDEQVDNPHFFLFSDDPDWVRQNLLSDYPMVFVSHNGADKNYEDLRLMSACQHHIIANSTFGWWAAWLCPNPEKIVYAPRRWFASSDRDARDLIPDAWNRI